MSRPVVGAGGGFSVATRRLPGAPVISLRCLLSGGSRSEEIPGQAVVTGRMLSEGTVRRGYRQLAEDLEGRGMVLSSFGTTEVHGVGLDALADDWRTSLETLVELIYEPAFDEDRCAFVRRQAAAELESMGDQPEVRAGWAFAEQLYAPHPRGRRLLGDRASLEALTPEDCRSLHRAALARRGVIAVTGAVEEEVILEELERLFGAPPADGRVAPIAEPPAPDDRNPQRRTVSTGSAVEQAVVYIGHRTVRRADPDYAALELASVILGAGSGLSGRIPSSIREREGLAYTAHAQAVAGAGLDPGYLVAFVGTAPETVERAAELAVDEIRRLVSDGIEEQELAAARSYLLGREPFRRETARQWAELLAEDEFYGVPLADPDARRAQLEAPDRSAVEAAVRRHLDAERLVVTVGLPGEPARAATGPTATPDVA